MLFSMINITFGEAISYISVIIIRVHKIITINYITRNTNPTCRAVGGVDIFDPSVFMKNHGYREVF